ncbi:hypothetical protein QRX60_31845 [Amycolatopsis mongoliensis]|uniref:Uncharacterized protein n=1 Tax=Amycolatopsis mongoliensis TaxID=715475 RepID=A0A9Y2JJ26_9PSEU|nr:hypothetical protein [Amycolatopsis sp. 4-36]WIX98644.1 hypothetical protein QRX60_31845 [Amycolatopsis sp. 4-36]
MDNLLSPSRPTQLQNATAAGADPLRRCNGVPVVEEAEIRGHWLAAEIKRSWINR